MNFEHIDKPQSNCGIFGVFNHPHASTLTYYGLLALQHRGQEACGIVTCEVIEGKRSVFNSVKSKGLVAEIFNDYKVINDTLKGYSAIGHNRYSTTGSDLLENIQPFIVKYRLGNLAISHNGNLTNARKLKQNLVNEGSIFRSSSDTEVILHLISKSQKLTQPEQICEALNKVEGAFSLVILTDHSLIAARDKFGVRPLSIGKIGESFVVASETCAFDLIGAEYLRDVRPGEIIIFEKQYQHLDDFQSYWLDNIPKNPKYCIFEFIYFSRPDSIVFGENVDKVRRKLGKTLAQESSLSASETDKLNVISVPDSSNTIAIGYQSQLRKQNIPSKLEIGLIRSHYIGRTFIQPGQDNREISVRIKFNTVKGVLNNKRVVLVDDSIVRGTTSKLLVKFIKEARPKEVHFRVSSPPILFPCYYGMDFPSKSELIANQVNGDINEIARNIGADSLAYLSLDGLIKSVPTQDINNYCTACFTGRYPIPFDENFHKDENEY